MRQKQNKQDKIEILKLTEKSRDTEQTTAIENKLKMYLVVTISG